MARRQDEDEAESRRILQRIAQETDPAGTSTARRMARNVRDRLGAADADRSDPSEYWGTRIGRTLGFLITIGLVVWLVRTLFNGG